MRYPLKHRRNGSGGDINAKVNDTLELVGLGDYAFALAFIVGLLSLIPVVGSVISAVVITASSGSWTTGPRAPLGARSRSHRSSA